MRLHTFLTFALDKYGMDRSILRKWVGLNVHLIHIEGLSWDDVLDRITAAEVRILHIQARMEVDAGQMVAIINRMKRNMENEQT